MATATDGGQAGFADVPLMDQEIMAACEEQLLTDEYAKNNRKAKAVIKDLIPKVSEPTRFMIGERFFVLATPYSVDGHEVSGGDRQRNRIVEASQPGGE